MGWFVGAGLIMVVDGRRFWCVWLGLCNVWRGEPFWWCGWYVVVWVWWVVGGME